jgi:cystathionine beta-lyase/cystathionine gamma-synthase
MTRIFDEDQNVHFATKAIHAGQRPDLLSGAIMTPIYTTSTYVQEALGQNKGLRVRSREESDSRGAREKRCITRRAAFTDSLSRVAWDVSTRS